MGVKLMLIHMYQSVVDSFKDGGCYIIFNTREEAVEAMDRIVNCDVKVPKLLLFRAHPDVGVVQVC